MKSIKIRAGLTALAILLGTAPSLAADGDDILQKHIDARGGLEKWGAVKTMKITGSYTGFSIPGTFELYRERPNRLYFDYALGDKRVTWGHDGESFWQVHGWMGERPMTLSEVDRHVVIQETDFATPFFNHQKRGHKVEYLGMEELEGERGHAFKLTRANGGEETWYLDPDTFLEFGRVGPGSDFGSPLRQTTFFSDFRDVNGLMIPFLTETEFRTRHRVMEVEKIEFNVEVDRELFPMPFPKVMAPFEKMVGSWKVSVEYRPNSRTPWQKSETTATIESVYNGNMLREAIVHAGFQGPIDAIRTLSHDDYRKKYRATVFNDFTYHQNILEGELKDGELTLTNTESGTTWEFRRTIHDKIVVKDITDDGFTVELYISRDGGENWINYVRLAYTKS